MRKIMSGLLAFVLIFTLVACVGPKNDTTQGETDSEKVETEVEEKDETAKDGETIKVAVVYTGLLGDKSYNDSANAGSKRALEDFNIEITSLEGSTPQEWESNLIAACEGDYDLIIGAASNVADFMEEYAPNYEDKKFAIIDTVVDLPNVQSVSFAQNEGSFLAGAAATMFTEKTDIEGVNPEAIIGWVGGMDVPVLHDFFIGYEQGAKYINPDIKILQSFAGEWSDPLKGKELTLAQYEQGADIVMNVASGTGVGVLEAAKEAGKYAIGVDLDQDNDQPGSILTSMVKRVDNAVYLIIESVVNDSFEGGTTQYLTLADGGISLTDFSVMREHLGDQFPEDIVEEIEIITEKINNGEIEVENYQGFGENK